jgi:hypothetical protein
MKKQTFFAVSKCLKIEKGNDAIFHFKGFYSGIHVKEIRIPKGEFFSPGAEYLLELIIDHFRRQVLYARVLRYRNLGEFKEEIF